MKAKHIEGYYSFFKRARRYPFLSLLYEEAISVKPRLSNKGCASAVVPIPYQFVISYCLSSENIHSIVCSITNCSRFLSLGKLPEGLIATCATYTESRGSVHCLTASGGISRS